MMDTIMSLQSKSFWIFDLDGTLTVPVHDFAFIRKELAIPADADILGHLDALPAAEATVRHARLQEIEVQLAYAAQPAPGALATIAALHQSGARLGILTRNDRDIALLTLKAIGMAHYFTGNHVLGRNEAPPKPDPAGILLLLSEWGAEPSEAVMVGDYLFDLQAGRAAGTTTVHVGRPDGKVWDEYADYHVATLVELARHIASTSAAVAP